jgi:hypothetical protein
MTTKPKRPKIQPVYLVGRKLIDPDTGEVVGALVAASPLDAKRLREMKLGADQIRAELKKPRNVKFHRLMHALGDLIAEHAPGFEGISAHDSIKRLQTQTGALCEIQELDLGQLGKVHVKVPRSIAFDSMTETEFGELFAKVCNWIDTNIAPSLTIDARGEYFTMTGSGNG